MPARTSGAPRIAAVSAEPTREPDLSRPRSKWKKRLIPVEEAVRRLQPHVDVPVVLPRDQSVLPSLRGWRADPRYLGWGETEGIRAGSMKLIKGQAMLILSYGLATFDGCGDRFTAVETDVLGQPALVTQAREALWSHILWPVTDAGSTGIYGITGTFEAWAMVRLAESMEAARRDAVEVDRSC